MRLSSAAVCVVHPSQGRWDIYTPLSHSQTKDHRGKDNFQQVPFDFSLGSRYIFSRQLGTSRAFVSQSRTRLRHVQKFGKRELAKSALISETGQQRYAISDVSLASTIQFWVFQRHCSLMQGLLSFVCALVRQP
ncbi:uncharacterized protein BDW70DRAFT_134412 [Aspergillus foveolatus]|uniref:uncharacterized protein n=1 Tax=Aspergillus foveolatus TaxID=210207 RepID=UPI003CCE1320